MNWFKTTAAAAALFCVATAPAAQAEQIAIGTSTGALYLVDTEDGTSNKVFDTPIMFDVALSSKDHLFGITEQGTLYKLHMEDKQTEKIGDTGVFINALVFDGKESLIGAGYQRLYYISTYDARAKVIGEYKDFNSSGDLALSPDGVIFATTSPGPTAMDSLVVISLDTFDMKPIGPIGFKNVYGMTWHEGRLLGMTEANEMIDIDPQTGKGTLIRKLDLEGGSNGSTGIHDLKSSDLGGAGNKGTL